MLSPTFSVMQRPQNKALLHLYPIIPSAFENFKLVLQRIY
jgi:hypothetical protein